jgi:hypothetical protein
MAILGALPGLLGAQEEPAALEPELTVKLHPWGQFLPGAWKVVSVKIRTFDERGEKIATTFTQTTLVEIDREGVTLEIAACLDVVGKRFEPEPQTIKQSFFGEPISADTKIHDPEDGQVEIDGRTIPCRVQQIESSGPNGKNLTTIHYSLTVAPYVFKRKTVTIDPAGKRFETSMDVTSMETPKEVLGETKDSYAVKIVQENPKGTVTTVASISPEIPGGIIDQNSEEVDKNGRVVRRSELELLAYSVDPDDDHGLFKSKRKGHRRSKGSSR